EQTVLVAFGQVADSLEALEHDAEQLDAQAHAQDVARDNVELQRMQRRRVAGPRRRASISAGALGLRAGAIATLHRHCAALSRAWRSRHRWIRREQYRQVSATLAFECRLLL